MPSAPPSVSAPSSDPTAVMGSRSVAWLVDAVLYLALMLFFLPTPVSPLATEYSDADNFDDACQVLQDADDDIGACLVIGDMAYTTDTVAALLQSGVGLAWFLLVYVVWQGYTGMTPGKALLGLRAVGENGQPPGMGKAFLRSILWIVDGLPGIPLVGFITALTSTGHRRVGDMAAKTYVVSKADAGKPIVVPGMTPAYGQPSPAFGAAPGATAWSTGQAPSPSYGTPSPGWGAQQPQQPGVGYPTQQPDTGYPAQPPMAEGPTQPAQPPFAEPTTAAPEQPAWPPTVPTAEPAEPAAPSPEPEPPAEAPAPEQAEEPSAPAEPFVAPSAEPATPEQPATTWPPATSWPAAAEPSEPAAQPQEPEPAEQPEPTPEAAPEPEPATATEYKPQWDAARGTYIQWDPNRERWLQWDDTAKEWKVI